MEVAKVVVKLSPKKRIASIQHAAGKHSNSRERTKTEQSYNEPCTGNNRSRNQADLSSFEINTQTPASFIGNYFMGKKPLRDSKAKKTQRRNNYLGRSMGEPSSLCNPEAFGKKISQPVPLSRNIIGRSPIKGKECENATNEQQGNEQVAKRHFAAEGELCNDD